MINIIKSYENKELVYDNLIDKLDCSIQFGNAHLKFLFSEIIDTQFEGGNVPNEIELLANFLKLGMYSKADCGGFPNFFKVESDDQSEYIIYSGINEPSNSHIIVTVHKILQLEKEE